MGHIDLTCFDCACQEEGAITTELNLAYGVLSRRQSAITIERRIGIWLKKLSVVMDISRQDAVTECYKDRTK